MELRFTPLGLQDLDEIWSFVACDSLDAADKFIDRILEKCCLIAENPGLGRARDDLAEGVRGFPVGNYLIFYHVLGDALFVDRVLSGYRDLLAVFPNDH
jgi:toxin ParE1/3/4